MKQTFLIDSDHELNRKDPELTACLSIQVDLHPDGYEIEFILNLDKGYEELDPSELDPDDREELERQIREVRKHIDFPDDDDFAYERWRDGKLEEGE